MPSKYGFEFESEQEQQQAQEAQRIDPIIRDILEDFASTLNRDHQSTGFVSEQGYWWLRMIRFEGPYSFELYWITYESDEAAKPRLTVTGEFTEWIKGSNEPLKHDLYPPERLLQVLERETGIRAVRDD